MSYLQHSLALLYSFSQQHNPLIVGSRRMLAGQLALTWADSDALYRRLQGCSVFGLLLKGCVVLCLQPQTVAHYWSLLCPFVQVLTPPPLLPVSTTLPCFPGHCLLYCIEKKRGASLLRTMKLKVYIMSAKMKSSVSLWRLNQREQIHQNVII